MLIPRVLLAFIFVSFVFVLTGCARPPRTALANDPVHNVWAGRLNLQVDSQPPQSFSAGFELEGQPDQGALTLLSPLGNVLGVLRWAPGEAMLDQGRTSQRFESLDALMVQITGAAVPMNALFAWLQGNSASVAGWTADLSRHSEGRIAAKRMQPMPSADLHIVLDR